MKPRHLQAVARVVGAWIALGTPAGDVRADAPKGSAWVGKRVVQRTDGFTVRVDGRPVEGGKLRIEIFRVEEADGDRLRLRAPGLEGWAEAREVVPVDDAIAFYTASIRDHPDDAFGYTMRATIRQKIKHDLDGALADYNEAIRVAPAASHVYNNRGNAYMARRDYDRAIADYGESLRLSPDNAIAWTNRGNAFAGKRRYDRAVENHDRAIALSPSYVAAYLNRAASFRALKQYDKAIADYDAAIRLDPRYPFAFQGRASAHLARDDAEHAFDDLDQAIKLDPRAAASYNARGQAHSQRREYDLAVADFDRAIALEPDLALSYSNRGLARRSQGDLKLALDDLDVAIRLDPRSGFLRNNRGIVREDLGDLAGARDDFDVAAHLDPGSGLPLRNKAVVGLIAGERAAITDARAAIVRDGWWPQTSIYSVLIGHFAARRAGELDEARRFLDDAFRRCDDAAWPYPVVRFLRREIDTADLLNLATDTDKRTEVRCYLGLESLLSGRADEARDHFRWVENHGTRSFMEYAIAVAERKRLKELPRSTR